MAWYKNDVILKHDYSCSRPKFQVFSNFRISSPSSFVTINPIDFVWATQVEFRRLLNGTNGDFQFLDFWNFGEYLNKEMSQNFDEFFKIENEVPEPWFPRYFHLWILCDCEIKILWRFDRQPLSFSGHAFQTDASSAAPSANQMAPSSPRANHKAALKMNLETSIRQKGQWKGHI